MLGRLSPLEVLHPDGLAERVRVLGGGCPETLAPARQAGAGERSDLIVVAPTPAELTRGWLENAARSVSGSLDGDGVAYLLVPRTRRLYARRMLSRHGLAVETAFAHLPDWRTTRYLLPLASGPASYALSSLIPVRTWRRRLAVAALTSPGGAALVAYALAAAGIVMRPPGARPLFEWLFELDDTQSSGLPAALMAGGHADGGSGVLHRFSGDGRQPTAVAKLRFFADPGQGPVAEAELLERIAAGAREVDASVPEPLVVEAGDGRSLLLEAPVKGRSVAVILGEGPHRLSEVHERIAGWLEGWNRSTAAAQTLNEPRLAEDVIAPARLLAPLLPGGQEYLSWLTARSTELDGTAIPLVGTHNDLTMSNLFLTESGVLGIVDWEAARENGLPLVDFLYAAADAAAAVERYDDRLQAFAGCFSDQGRYT